MDILTILSGANLVVLLGLLGKIWAWSAKLEGRLAKLEGLVEVLLKRDEARLWYAQSFTKEAKDYVQIP